MPIPDIDNIHLPVLRLIGDRKDHKIRDVIDHIAAFFAISSEERQQITLIGKKPILDTRVTWAVSQLRHAELLENTQRGVFKITDRGIEALKQNPAKIDRRFLMRYPEFREYIGASFSRDSPTKRNRSPHLEIDGRSTKIILKDEQEYKKIIFKNEKHLEELVIANKHSLFGNDIIFIEKKRSLVSKAKISGIPDGLLLTIPNIHTARLWSVEIELSKHDLHHHIFPQITRFVQAMRNEPTKRKIREILYQEIKENKEIWNKIKRMLPPDGEVHPFLEDVLHRELRVIIIIDNKTAQLEESTETLGTEILEFSTFRNAQGETIHLLDTLQANIDKKARFKSDNYDF